MLQYSQINNNSDKTGEILLDVPLHSRQSIKPNSLCWENISVWCKHKEKGGIWQGTRFQEVQIVQRISAFIPEGSLLVIMGPSGSGKTTLLAAISQRIREGIEGNVYVNGEKVNADQMLSLSGLVPQDDLTVESLTVLEHMKMMAILKMDRRIPEFQRLTKVLMLMEDIGIKNIASSYICNLSGGERRKLSIAVQMLTDPLLLFCDEPTTGLDSATAFVVINTLKRFSSKGKIAICSIHQPAASTFELFDNVLLLTTGGRLAYFGSVPNAKDFFRKQNLTCPANYNIAEFLINQISLTKTSSPEKVNNICSAFSKSKSAAIVQERIKAVCFNNYLSSDQRSFFMERKKDLQPLAEYYRVEKISLLTQCALLTKRSFLDMKKNYTNFATHALTYMFSATVISYIFAKSSVCTDNSLQNIRGFITCMVLETIYEFAYFEFNTFPEERALFMREINSGLYTPQAYCLSKLLSKSIISTVLPLLFVTLMQTISHAFDHLLFWELAIPFMAIATMSTAYGCMLSSMFDNVNILLVIAAGYEIPAYLLAGITLKLSSLPPFFSSLRYFSFFYYAIEYVIVLQWDKASRFHCVNDVGPDKSNIKQLSPLEFLDEYGFSLDRYQDNLWIFFLLTVVFYYTTYRIILKRSKNRVAY